MAFTSTDAPSVYLTATGRRMLDITVLFLGILDDGERRAAKVQRGTVHIVLVSRPNI